MLDCDGVGVGTDEYEKYNAGEVLDVSHLDHELVRMRFRIFSMLLFIDETTFRLYDDLLCDEEMDSRHVQAHNVMPQRMLRRHLSYSTDECYEIADYLNVNVLGYKPVSYKKQDENEDSNVTTTSNAEATSYEMKDEKDVPSKSECAHAASTVKPALPAPSQGEKRGKTRRRKK